MLYSSLVQSLTLLVGVSQASQLQHIEQSLGIKQISTPSITIDSSSSDTLQILGNVDDLSFYTFSGQQNFTKDITKDKLIYYSDDIYIQLEGNIDDGAAINKIVPFGSDSFILSGHGNFANLNLNRQILYNLTDFSSKPIFDSSITTIDSIFVDNSLVYFGGNFTYSNGSTKGHSIATWDSTKNKTNLLPFVGFGENSTVNSIVKLNNDNILFSGQFWTLDEPTLLINSINSSSYNNISSLYGQNLSTIELNPLIPLKKATWNIEGGATFDSSDFICPNSDNEAWSMDGAAGSLSCKLPYNTAPTKIRIFNSPNSNNEVSSFRIVTQPSNSIMNLTYIDPLSGDIKFCDAFCPLFNRQTLENQLQNKANISSTFTLLNGNTTILKWSSDFQDFAFVNLVSVASLTFNALSSFGSNVGLAGINLYQNSFDGFANNTLNQQSCDNIDSTSSVTLSGNHWTQGQIDQSYIATYFTPNEDSIPTVKYDINLDFPGFYSIDLYTPGCAQDGTCATRGIVNVTVWNSNDTTLISNTQIYQNNDQLKYDRLYSGYLDSSCQITLAYLSGLSSTTSPVTVVADRVSVNIQDLNMMNTTSSKNGSNAPVKLNGLFQYQISNFTSSFNNSNRRIAPNPIVKYTVDKFSKNTTVFVALYNNNTLLLADSKQGISNLQLDNKLQVSSTNDLSVKGSVSGLASYSKGVFFFGNGFDISNDQSNNIIYNGSFSSINSLKSTSVSQANNITLGNSEFLVMDNQHIFNVSSSSGVSNSSVFSLSLWSAGQNANSDTLFFGGVSQSDYGNLNSSISIDDSNKVSKINFRDNIEPYMGLYLNQSSTAYAYNSNGKDMIYFSNSNNNNIKSWSSTIRSMLYSQNQTLLVVSTGSSSGKNAQVSILNTTTGDTIKDLTLNSGSQVNSIVNYPSNSTIMIGGNFTISDVNCDGLCLYNYKDNEWSSFANGSISGTITQLQFYNGTHLIMSGNFDSDNTSSITLATLDLLKFELRPLKRSNSTTEEIDSFVVDNDKIIIWGKNTIDIFENQVWSQIDIANTNTSSEISSAGSVSIQNTISKRDTITSDSLLLQGQFFDSKYGNIQALLYNYKEWIPYLLLETSSSDNQHLTAFINKDTSLYSNSQFPLQNPNSTTTTTLPPTSQIPKKHNDNKNHIRRGFVVLIGLALALGTVTVLGLVGVILATFLRDDDTNSQTITPRIDENEMIDTVPPEKLMKYI